MALNAILVVARFAHLGVHDSHESLFLEPPARTRTSIGTEEGALAAMYTDCHGSNPTQTVIAPSDDRSRQSVPHLQRPRRRWRAAPSPTSQRCRRLDLHAIVGTSEAGLGPPTQHVRLLRLVKPWRQYSTVVQLFYIPRRHGVDHHGDPHFRPPEISDERAPFCRIVLRFRETKKAG